MHETFDHTADLGLRVRAPDLDTLFAEAAEALSAVLVEERDTVRATMRVEVYLTGTDRELLLFDWLKELLYHFDSEHLLFGKFEVKLDGGSLTATAWGEPLDRNRHVLEHEVKAITYHGLSVVQVEG